MALVVPVRVHVRLGDARILSRGIPLLLEKPPGETVDEVDRLAAAAREGGRGGRDVPHQVAFNRRYVPLVAALRDGGSNVSGPAAPLQHVRYEMVRVNRRDPDFSTTAVHAIDAVRFITGSDFAEIRFRYQDLPALGAGVANIFMDAVMRSGATAHLSFCPVAGVVVERAELHARDHTFFLEIPMWNGYDSPGPARAPRARHGRRGHSRRDGRRGAGRWCWAGSTASTRRSSVISRRGGRPAPTARGARQSVEVAEAMRARRSEWRS